MSIWNKILQWFRDIIRAIDRKLIIPTMKAIVRYFSGKLEERVGGIHNLADWKQAALEDFKYWLSDLPDTRADAKSLPPDACDLYTLLSEFGALRKEIEDQNRKRDKTMEGIETLAGKYEKSNAIFEERYKDIATLEERIRKTSEKNVSLHFLDIRDDLARGRAQSITVAAFRGLFRSPPKGIDQISEGYESAIRKLDRCLGEAGIQPMETVERPFDAGSMKAVEERSVPDMANGIVLEEKSAGYIREGEVLKMAEVVINIVKKEPAN